MNKTSTFATWRQAAMNCRFASRFIIISSIFLINNMPTYIYLCALSVWSCFVWLFATVPSWIQLFWDCLLRDGMTRWQLRVWLHWKSVCSSQHFGKGRERAQSREKPMQRLQLLILSHCQSEEPHVDTLPGGFDWRELIPLRECAPPITTLGGWGVEVGGALRWDEDTRYALFPPFPFHFPLLSSCCSLCSSFSLLNTCKSAPSPTQSQPLILIALSGSKAKLTCSPPSWKPNDYMAGKLYNPPHWHNMGWRDRRLPTRL